MRARRSGREGPAHDLPRLFHRMQPDLVKEDYPPFRHRHRAVWLAAMLALGLLGHFGKGALAAGVGANSPVTVWAGMLGLIGLFSPFGIALLLPKELNRIRRRTELVERAEALRLGG